MTLFSFQEFLKKSDRNQSGDLTKSEFVEYLRDHEEKLRRVFADLDENDDGELCTREVVAAFKKMGVSVTEEEAEKLTKR